MTEASTPTYPKGVTSADHTHARPQTEALIAQLEERIQHKQRSAFDCANCGFEANLIDEVVNAIAAGDEARGQASKAIAQAELLATDLARAEAAEARLAAVEADRDELAALLNEGGTWEAQLSAAEARATAAETRVAELTRERDAAREVSAFVDTWVSQPVGAYSVHALDGLFAMTRDRISAARTLIEKGNADGQG